MFVLTFVNLAGLALIVSAFEGFERWTRWQFVALFGAIEAGAGLSNILAPNVWHLPVAEMETSRRTSVRLAASTLLIPHWGGAARASAGVCLLLVGAWQEGLAAESLLLLPLIGGLALLFLGVGTAMGRLAVAYPSLDTVRFIVHWRDRETPLQPLSISASVQQFFLSVLTLPAVKLLEPGALFAPTARPSDEALLAVLLLAAASVLATALLWWGRLDWRAPREQQREAEQNA